jgi:hypothetical protein
MIPRELAEINTVLKTLYGSHSDGRALWRVVKVRSETENRLGTYDKFYNDNIWIGRETGRQERPKYGYLHPEAHVIEKLVWRPEVTLSITGSEIKLGYEPVGGAIKPELQDKSGILQLAQRVIYAVLEAQKVSVEDQESYQPKGNPSETDTLQQEKEKKFEEFADTIISDRLAGVPTSTGEAIQVPANIKNGAVV